MYHCFAKHGGQSENPPGKSLPNKPQYMFWVHVTSTCISMWLYVHQYTRRTSSRGREACFDSKSSTSTSWFPCWFLSRLIPEVSSTSIVCCRFLTPLNNHHWLISLEDTWAWKLLCLWHTATNDYIINEACRPDGHYGTDKWAFDVWVQSQQPVWWSGTHKFHLPVPILKLSAGTSHWRAGT